MPFIVVLLNGDNEPIRARCISCQAIIGYSGKIYFTSQILNILDKEVDNKPIEQIMGNIGTTFCKKCMPGEVKVKETSKCVVNKEPVPSKAFA